jgi:hypothetical protein
VAKHGDALLAIDSVPSSVTSGRDAVSFSMAAAVSRRRALMSTPAMRAAAPKVATRPTVARAILFFNMAKCGL